MKILLGVCIVGAILWGATSSVLAAQAVLPRSGNPDVHLRTGTTGGVCIAAPAEDGLGVVVECEDGLGNAARADSFHGCLAAKGRAQCYLGVPPAQPFVTEDVQCPNGGHTFRLTTGNDKGGCASTMTASKSMLGAQCFDTEGNGAGIDCGINGGAGGCDSDAMHGSGGCQCLDCARNPAP